MPAEPLTSQAGAGPVTTPSTEDVRPVRLILGATDFSPNSVLALRWAAALCRAHQARLVIVHASGDDEPLDSARVRLANVAERTGLPDPAHSTRLERGRPAQVIARLAGEERADCIVLGALGTGAVKRLLLGGTATHVARESTVPIVIVHPDDSDPEGGLRRVLVATDLSDDVSRLLMMAARLLRDPEAGRITLFHASVMTEAYVEYGVSSAAAVPPIDWSAVLESARMRLESDAAPLRARGWTVDTVTRADEPAGGVLTEAETTNADLIVIGTRARSGLGRLLMGSVAESVVGKTRRPVMLVPPGTGAA